MKHYTRIDDDFFIMARSDAIAVDGIDAAIERGQRYREAGADMIFIEAPDTVEEMKRITSEIDAPTVANLIYGGHTPLLSVQELQNMGFSMVVYPTSSTYIVAKATIDYFEQLAKTGSLVGMEDKMIKFELFNKIVGLPKIRASEKKYYGERS